MYCGGFSRSLTLISKKGVSKRLYNNWIYKNKFNFNITVFISKKLNLKKDSDTI
jgi:hypothetical protein